ncbi:hypothetical protein GCM10022207_65530 [Streptomyces lannensis]|uniref:Uncharacterized protein n=1 Tax=Streptomyces lannensis TaxID=766498 RepID=A0ABP7KW82_9ACTN
MGLAFTSQGLIAEPTTRPDIEVRISTGASPWPSRLRTHEEAPADDAGALLMYRPVQGLMYRPVQGRRGARPRGRHPVFSDWAIFVSCANDAVPATTVVEPLSLNTSAS